MMSTSNSCAEVEKLWKSTTAIDSKSSSQLLAKRSTTDSQATYCSEVEELLKLTTEIDNKSCSQLPARRSQRLSQKYQNNECFSWNNICISSTGKLFKKSRSKQKQPYSKRSLKQEDPQTQEIFSTQDIREAQDSTLTDITCNQPHVNAEETYANNEPLNLSKKVIFTNDLLTPRNSSFSPGLNCNQQRGITLNEKVTINVPLEDVHLDLSMKSKVLTQKISVQNSKEDLVLGRKLQNTSFNSLKDNEKPELSIIDYKKDLAFLKVLTQDIQQTETITNLINNTKIINTYESTPEPTNTFVPKTERCSPDFQHKQPNVMSTCHLNKNNLTVVEAKCNLDIKQIEKLKLPNKKVGRPRKTSSTDKKPTLKLKKNSGKNKTANTNYLPINELKYIQNMPKTTQDSSNKSILPDLYPPHFKYQLPPEAVLNRPLFPQPTMITPDNTPSCELIESTSTSPSLPDSLRGIFDTDDIKDILNIEKVAYRLYDYHVQALAVVLNVRVQYLTEILDKIVQMNSNVLKNVDKAIKMPFIEDCDLFAATPEGSPQSNGDMVPCSQSPGNQRLFSLTKEKLKN